MAHARRYDSLLERDAEGKGPVVRDTAHILGEQIRRRPRQREHSQRLPLRSPRHDRRGHRCAEGGTLGGALGVDLDRRISEMRATAQRARSKSSMPASHLWTRRHDQAQGIVASKCGITSRAPTPRQRLANEGVLCSGLSDRVERADEATPSYKSDVGAREWAFVGPSPRSPRWRHRLPTNAGLPYHGERVTDLPPTTHGYVRTDRARSPRRSWSPPHERKQYTLPSVVLLTIIPLRRYSSAYPDADRTLVRTLATPWRRSTARAAALFLTFSSTSRQRWDGGPRQ